MEINIERAHPFTTAIEITCYFVWLAQSVPVVTWVPKIQVLRAISLYTQQESIKPKHIYILYPLKVSAFIFDSNSWGLNHSPETLKTVVDGLDQFD